MPYNLPKSSILRLQRIQNQVAHILTRTPRRDHITEVLIDLHWLKIKERIVYTILILTFKAFIDRTAPLYLCELIEQQIHGWQAMLFCWNIHLLVEIVHLFSVPFFMGLHMNGTSWMNVSGGWPTLTCLSLKSKRCYFSVILIISIVSLLADHNSMVIFKTFTFMSHYIDWICIVLPLLYIVYRFL